MIDTTRIMSLTETYWTDRNSIEPERLDKVEGVDEAGHVVVRRLMVGENILFLHVLRAKGLIDPTHKHDDHESVGYLVKGRMRVRIGDKEFIATPGTCWRHPAGVLHYSEALEDCEQIEIKSPPRKTWTTK